MWSSIPMWLSIATKKGSCVRDKNSALLAFRIVPLRLRPLRQPRRLHPGNLRTDRLLKMTSMPTEAGVQWQNGAATEAETGRGLIRSRRRAAVMTSWRLDRRGVLV